MFCIYHVSNVPYAMSCFMSHVNVIICYVMSHVICSAPSCTIDMLHIPYCLMYMSWSCFCYTLLCVSCCMFLLHPVYIARCVLLLIMMFHALHHLRRCMSFYRLFLRMYRCCFYVTCHFTCYVTSMSCYMLCIYPKNTPFCAHIAPIGHFLTLFGVLKKPCCHLDTPKNTPFLASRVAQLCDTGPQIPPKIGPKWPPK